MASGVMNSDAQSSHYGGSPNGPWNKIMTLMEKMMTVMRAGSPVMAFRTGMCWATRRRNRGAGVDSSAGTGTAAPDRCRRARPCG